MTTWGPPVCLYTPSRDASGMGAHMIDLAAALAPEHDVSVMAWATPAGRLLLERAEAVGARPVSLPHPRSPAFSSVITAHLARHPTDVFHVHVGTGREDFDGARTARAAGVPAVVQTLHYPWLMGSTKHRIPFFHALEPVDRVLTVSLAQRRTYERIGVPRELMSTVANGIRGRELALGRGAARESLGLDPDQPVVLTVGRLTVMKGHTHLLEAVPSLVRRFPDLAVVVVGDGHLHEQLVDQSVSLGVADNVRLVGHRADARGLLDAADVFVLPSLHEGMPLVLLEAMDAGLPVVATRVIGSEEVVVDEETGLLVRPRDPGALAGALGRLLDEPALRAGLGAAGRRRYEEHFTSARMAEQTRQVYEQVLRAASTERRAPGRRLVDPVAG